MNPPTADQSYQQAVALLNRLYPPAVAVTFRPQIPPERQQTEIRLLTETVGFERFFFVVDLLERQIHSAQGLKTWLGYDDHQFSLRDYFHVLHPDHLFALNALAESAFRNPTGLPIDFLTQRYIVTLAIRHRDGHYLTVKRISSPFQLNQHRQVLAYLNEFTIVGELPEGAPMPDLQPRITDQFTRRPDLEKLIRPGRDDSHPGESPFSWQQLRVLRQLAYSPTATPTDIAASLQIRPGTLETHQKRAVRHARQFFLRDFGNAAQVAVFMRENWLL